jgi:hypothetical protein
VKSIPDSAFLSLAVKIALLDGRKGCGSGLDGKNLQRQYKDFRTTVRKVFADLPTDYSSIPSGKQLYDIISDHIATIFKKNAKVCVILTRVFLAANILCLTIVVLSVLFAQGDIYTNKTLNEIKKNIPTNYWLEDSKCKHVLTLLCHRHNNDFTPTADKSSKVTRKDQQQAHQQGIAKERQVIIRREL